MAAVYLLDPDGGAAFLELAGELVDRLVSFVEFAFDAVRQPLVLQSPDEVADALELLRHLGLQVLLRSSIVDVDGVPGVVVLHHHRVRRHRERERHSPRHRADVDLDVVAGVVLAFQQPVRLHEGRVVVVDVVERQRLRLGVEKALEVLPQPAGDLFAVFDVILAAHGAAEQYGAVDVDLVAHQRRD